MNRNTLHFHPKVRVANVFGWQLGSEDVIEKGDYRPTADKWELVPDGFVGTTACEHMETVIIRPANEWKRPELSPEKPRNEGVLPL